MTSFGHVHPLLDTHASIVLMGALFIDRMISYLKALFSRVMTKPSIPDYAPRSTDQMLFAVFPRQPAYMRVGVA